MITITPPYTPPGGSTLTAATATQILTSPTLGTLLSATGVEFNVLSLEYAGRTGMCGNGICEVGEREFQRRGNGTCAADCPAGEERFRDAPYTLEN